ncbi:MAG: hypothetical protein AAF555_11730 [Verrucomicrobiota bacterium]
MGVVGIQNSPEATPVLYLFGGLNGSGKVFDLIDDGLSFGLESTLSGTSQRKWLERAKCLGYQIELHFL